MWLFLFFLPLTTAFSFFGIGNSPSRPISVDKKKPHLMPRAASFLLHHSALPSIPREILPTDRPFYNAETKKLDELKNASWKGVMTADWYYQGMQEEKYFQLLKAFFLADPALRRTEYAGDQVCGNSSTLKLVQKHTDPGFPMNIQCLTCTNHQSVNEFRILPNRNVLNISTLVPYISSLLRTTHSLIKAEIPGSVSVLQSFQRGPGGGFHLLPSSSILRSFDVVPVPSRPSEKFKAKQTAIEALQRLQGVQFGASFQYIKYGRFWGIHECGLPYRSHFPYREKYEIYENWDRKPVNVIKGSLKLEIVWEPWGCCSACCCSIKQCGVLATEKKCDQVYSVKTRKGHLSLVKENHNQKVKLDQAFNGQSSEEYKEAVHLMEGLFDLNPYKSVGIPVFSTLIPKILRNDIHTAFTSEFLDSKNSSMTNYTGAGLFVDVQSCKDDPQKKDCQVWENCRGSIRNREDRESEEEGAEVDPCRGEEMTTLVLDQVRNTFKVHKGRSYRLQVDDSVFPVSKSIRWKTGTSAVSQYDHTKSCVGQRKAVLPNGKHLILIKLTEKDLQLRIEAKLSTGQKLVAKFSDAEEKMKNTKGVVTVIIWGSVILVFIILLVGIVALMHKLRVHRTHKILERQPQIDREQTATEKA